MPNRFIKECCRSSPTLHKLTNFQERLFWRLLTVADDYGRFEANVNVIKNTCFPLGCKETITDVNICMQILADSNTLILYTNDGREYGQFVNFIIYQGEPRAKKSKHPDPPLKTSANICSPMLPSSVSVSESDVRLPSESSDDTSASNGKQKRKSPQSLAERPEDVSEQVWNDFQIQRKAKKAPFTATALKQTIREANKAGITLEDALQMCCRGGWQGFEARYVKKQEEYY